MTGLLSQGVPDKEWAMWLRVTLNIVPNRSRGHQGWRTGNFDMTLVFFFFSNCWTTLPILPNVVYFDHVSHQYYESLIILRIHTIDDSVYYSSSFLHGPSLMHLIVVSKRDKSFICTDDNANFGHVSVIHPSLLRHRKSWHGYAPRLFNGDKTAAQSSSEPTIPPASTSSLGMTTS